MNYTALHWAAATGHNDIVELLLHSGADPNVLTTNGDSPLHLATFKGHSLVVATLLKEEWKVDVDVRNRDGKKAEELARSDAVRDAFAKSSSNLINVVQDDDDDDDSSDEE